MLACAKLPQLSLNYPFKLSMYPNSLMGKVKGTVLPSVYPSHNLAQVFSDYFCDKVRAIRDDIDRQSRQHILDSKLFSGSVLSRFSVVSKTTVREKMHEVAPKPCDLDPTPTSLLYGCIDEIVPMLTDVLNVSIASGSVPNSLKKAIRL